jgi:Carboxypeptidase regulatory-like domain/TonB dependent receptor
MGLTACQESQPMKRIPFLVPALLVLFGSATGFAQVAGVLSGRVLDPSGAAVPNAQVALTADATHLHQATLTTSSGNYVFVNLTPGTYQVDVAAPGFSRLARKGIAVMVGATVTADLRLTVGAAQETVTVAGDAPLLQASTSNIQTNIQGAVVTAIPLNSRNFVNLATLAPGVELPPGTVLPRINGGRPRTNEYLYDGISALQPEPGQVAFFPIIDDIQEFTIEANNVPAEFGRFNGGVVNISTRSGSNQLHGSLYEFFRNEDLNARNYFAPTGAKPEYRRNLYGATLGAPVLRDKLFFFGDFQGVRQLIGRTVYSNVPTVNERAGNFSGVSKIYDPSTTTSAGARTEFTNDTITTPFDTAASSLLKLFPTPTDLTKAANNYSRTANDIDHQSQLDVRVDGAYKSRDRAFGRYSYYNEVEQPVTPLPDGSGLISGTVIGTGGVAGLSNVVGQQAVLNETHTFNAHLLNDLRAGYTRRSNNIAGPTLSNTASTALGIPGIPTNAAFNNAVPLFTITNFQQLGPSASTFSKYQTGVWQIVDSLTEIRGRHTLKAGVDMRWYQLNAVAPPNPTGSFAFTTTGTDTLSSGVTSGGNALASFLLGQVDTFQIDLQTSVIRPRDHIFEYFAQDDWKLANRLTLNLGARWSLHFPSTEKNNQGAVFNLATQQLDYVGVNGNSKSARQLHYTNVAPRVGFAYLLTPRTVVRAGYGIVFIDQSGITTPFTIPQFPFIQNVTQKTSDSVVSPFTLSNGPSVSAIPLNASAGLGQSVYTVDRTAGSGYSQQWNLAFQRELTGHLSVEAAYVGSHIVHVGIPDSNLNQLTVAQMQQGGATLLTKTNNPCFGQAPSWTSLGGQKITIAQYDKPYQCFQNVATYRHNSGETNYNAGEIKFEQRITNGLELSLAFTHSRLIDDASSVFSTTVLSSPNSSSLIAADTFNPRLERDVSTGDMSNVTAFSGVYDLPAGKGHRFASMGLANEAIGGWRLDAILQFQSGMPVAVTQATNNNSAFGFALQRPNLVRSPNLVHGMRSPSQFFDTLAFQTANQFTLGNASRDPVRGPDFRNLDVALIKHTSIGEKIDVEFRAEIFDIPNRANFAQPNGSFGNPAFGTIISTVTDPRVVQFALRISR